MKKQEVRNKATTKSIVKKQSSQIQTICEQTFIIYTYKSLLVSHSTNTHKWSKDKWNKKGHPPYPCLCGWLEKLTTNPMNNTKSQPGQESRWCYESMWWGIWPSQEVREGFPKEVIFHMRSEEQRELTETGESQAQRRAQAKPFSKSERSMVEDL